MRHRSLWLVAALALLALAAFLMARDDQKSPAAPEARVQFPRGWDPAAAQRRLQRQVLAAPAEPTPGEHPSPRRPRDPLLAALPATPGKTTLVLEANALFESPIGRLLLDCIRREEGRDVLEELQKSAGIDLRKDLDRIAVSDGVVLASGHFERVRGTELFAGARPRPLGEGAVAYELPTANGRATPVAIWRDQLILLGDTPEQLALAVDRIEGRGPPAPPALDDDATYGELYGVLGPDLIDGMLANGQPELAARLRDVTDRVELHVNAMDDVAMVAEVRGPDAEKLKDLARSLGGALALARLQSQASGEKPLAELLDLARVEPQDGHFTVELAVPMPWLEKQLASCREPRRRAPASAGGEP